jgi:hypothetical protein
MKFMLSNNLQSSVGGERQINMNLKHRIPKSQLGKNRESYGGS